MLSLGDRPRGCVVCVAGDFSRREESSRWLWFSTLFLDAGVREVGVQGEGFQLHIHRSEVETKNMQLLFYVKYSPVGVVMLRLSARQC